MRDSDWRITWNPAGEAPRVLLDFGDPMDGEIQRDLVQVVDVGRFDQATQGRPFGRKNRKRRLEFNRLVEFDSSAGAFLAMIDAAMNDPWGEKSLVQIAPKLAGSIYGRAAMLSFERDFVTQPKPGYIEKYAFRVDSGATGPGTPAITIISGWFNPPLSGGGTGSGSITVVLGPGHGLTPGDVVFVDGVAGVTPGYYSVSAVNGNNVTIDAPSDKTPAADEFPDVFGTDDLDPISGGGEDHHGAGAVNFNGTVRIRISGMTEVGASYEWRSGGAWNAISPDSFGRDEITYNTQLLRIDHGGWYRETYAGKVLTLDGEAEKLTTSSESLIPETRMDLAPFELRKNGVKIDEHPVAPFFKVIKRWTYQGPRFHDIATGKTLTITLRADGGTARLNSGVAERITAGTVQKAS